MSTGKPRPLLPGAWTRKIFDINHEIAHVGARAMRRMIYDRFVWSGMARYIILWALTSVACQRTKVSQHTVAPSMPLPMPPKRFDSLHVDLVGPLPESQGFTYVLTIVDRFTRWPEAIPISAISAATCARAFLYHWVSRHGIPYTFTSDRGKQFRVRSLDENCIAAWNIHQHDDIIPSASERIGRTHASYDEIGSEGKTWFRS